MKKSVKRIACGALSLLMLSSIVLERSLRSNAGEAFSSGVTTVDASFKEVTGQFDTTALKESFFNDSVLKSSGATYETRTVMITLAGENLVERAKESTVAEYLTSWSGNRAAADIQAEQEAFLSKLSKAGIPYKLERSYNTVLNGVAIEIDTKYVSEIKKLSGVESVVITTAYAEPKTYTTSSTTVVSNETTVYETGIYDSSEYQAYGAGTVVAVLDTGLDYTHEAFQRFQSEAPVKAWDEAYIKNVLAEKNLIAEDRSGSLKSSDVYVSEKVPFAYDYADDDADVYPSYSNHGTHVAGIIGGYDTSGYTDKDGNHRSETFKGVVPDAQLAIFKVFTDDLDSKDLGGAVAEDIIAALEDCVKLNVDVINMSLGTSCGFTTTDDGDSEGELLNSVYNSIQQAGISLVCAASNDYSSGYGGVYGTNLASNPDSSTVGSPSTFAAALSVASINGQKANYMIANAADEKNKAFVFYEESRDIDGNPFDFANDLYKAYNKKEFEYVVIPGIGQSADYSSSIKKLLPGRIALIKRGDTTFQEKVELAMEMGAIGVIVYNNVAGVIRMNLGEIENPVPSVSVNMNAGNTLIAGAKNRVGTLTIDDANKAGPFMSEFSSWGPTHDLKLKPEITAHGGEITSTVPGGYGEQSGTSMASPNMAGFTALVRSYIEKNLSHLVKDGNGNISSQAVNRLAMQMIMSTATTAYDQDNLPYSPRKQGAGVARMEYVIGGTSAYLSTDVAENDYRPKIELGDDPSKTGSYTLNFKVTNFGATDLRFTTQHLFMTETLSADGLTVNEQARMLDKSTAVWKVNGAEASEISVKAGATANVSVTLTMDKSEKAYIDKSFENGMYVEGFLKLVSTSDKQCDLSIPFLGFYGDWESSPMLDYTSFEVAKNEQDGSVKEEDKIKASVWATHPYTSYYNEKYILPMGGYVYLLPEDDDPVYVNEEYCSVSRYNEYYGEGATENYLTSTQIKAVYAGLLRNARIVKYKMYNVETGELILEDECTRVGKAYSGGGSAVPGNVELELSAEEKGLVANGKYRLDFEFYMNDPNVYTVYEDDPTTAAVEDCNNSKGTYSFSFTVDYEAPILENARVRYYNYKDGNKEKQRIYLDVDVFDNHYAQALMLCYPKTNAEGEVVLQLATDYPTPIRNGNKNGTTTVSIEITDIYEKYGNQLYVQLDDYAVNSCLYQLNINTANANVLPNGKDFTLAKGEKEVSLDIYGTHKVALVYGEEYKGEADISNFLWVSKNPGIADVKNGEIVGLAQGTTEIVVSNRKGATESIKVTVSDKKASIVSVPSISFGVIKTSDEALKKASGVVEVNPGEEFTLNLETDPWYHPMTDLRLVWSTTNPNVVSVDQNGNVKTLKKGTSVIEAKVEKRSVVGETEKWETTLYAASVTLKVQNEFTVSNYTLLDYNGVGYNAWVCATCKGAWLQGELVMYAEKANSCPDCAEKKTQSVCTQATDILKIPTDMNIMYIGEEAFKDNAKIRKVIIPSSVLNINARAFMNCKNLEEVYFVSMAARTQANGTENPDIDWADLSLIYEHGFYGCTSLKKVDLSNVKTITVALECFANCTALEEIVDMPGIGTMHHRAFYNCVSLKSVDLTGLHMSGDNVFEGCVSISEIKTGEFTALGNYMFKDCVGLVAPTYAQDNSFYGLILSTPKIGVGAFSGCINLAGVKLDSPSGKELSFDIGAYAFENCGKALKGDFVVDFNGEIVRSIGNRAFSGSSLRSITSIDGLQILGANVFANTEISVIYINNSIDIENLTLTDIPFEGLRLQIVAEEGGAPSKYVEENGVIYNAAKTKLLYVNPSVTGTLNVPATVTEINDYALAASNVEKVVLSASVVRLGVGAFESSALKEIDFNGAALTEIPEKAFKNTNLTSIGLPIGITTIGKYAFADSALSTFVGAGIKSTAEAPIAIGDGAFQNCIALQTVSFADHAAEMGSYVFSGCSSLKEVTLPSVSAYNGGNGGMGEYTFYNAKALEKVTFGASSTVTGKYTFAWTPVVSVTFGANTKRIDEGAFYHCRSLKTITLPTSVQTVGAFAFESCTALESVNGIEDVEAFETQAFYNAGLKGTLSLESAKTIGNFAFAMQSERQDSVAAAYSALEIPQAVTIGNFAFLNGSEESISLSETLKEVGYGAFASSAKLKTISVAAANTEFVSIENVLYRYIDKKAGTYELVCYPAGKTVEAQENKKTYSVVEGTVLVQAYAFYELNSGALDKVILPYSVNSIGDSAFFASGIQEYTFESIQAPVLEAVYRSEIEESIKQSSSIAYYKGYYYSNFDGYLYNYTDYVREESPLTINYPTNGVGYNNHIYGLYFGTKNTTGILIEDETRECIRLLEGMPTAAELDTALANGTLTKANVEEYAATMKLARLYYNNAIEDAEQSTFLTSAHTEKLLAVEESMRKAKKHFNIPIVVTGLEIDDACVGQYKTEYLTGEKFDKTGLKILLVYDDYSTELADWSTLVLETSGELTKYDRYVVITYTDEDNNKQELRVSITVSETAVDNAPIKDEKDNDTWWIVLLIVGGVLLVGGGAVAVFFLLKKKKSIGQESVETAEAEEAVEAEQEEQVSEEAVEESSQPSEEE